MGCGCGKSFTNRGTVATPQRNGHSPTTMATNYRSPASTTRHAPTTQPKLVVQSASLQRRATTDRRQV